MLASLLFCAGAYAREYAPAPHNGGFAENPDGTDTFYTYEGDRTATWSKTDYDAMSRAFRAEELLTEGTGQGSEGAIREWVKGIKTDEIGEGETVVEHIEAADPVAEVLTPYPSVPVREVGTGIEESAAADGIMPAEATLLETVTNPFGFTIIGGTFLVGVSIGNYIDTLAGWPSVESFIEGITGSGHETERAYWEWTGGFKVSPETNCKSLHEETGGAEIPVEGKCWPITANRIKVHEWPGVETLKTTTENGIGRWTGQSLFRGGSEEHPCLENPETCDEPECPSNPIGKPLGFVHCSEENGTPETEDRPRYSLFAAEAFDPVKYGSWPRLHQSGTCKEGTVEVSPESCTITKPEKIKTKLEPVTPTEWNPRRATEEETQHVHREHHTPLEEEHKIPGSPIIEPEVPEVKPGELESPYVNEVHTAGFPNVTATELPLEQSDPAKGPEAVTTVTPSPGTHAVRESTVHVDYNNKAEPEPAESEETAKLGAVTVPPISLPKVGPLCKAFPFGVPCWLIETIKGWVTARVTPEWCLQHYEIPFLHRTIATRCQSLAFLEPEMGYLRPAMLLFGTLGLVLLFFNFTRGGGLPSGGGTSPASTPAGSGDSEDDDLFGWGQ